MKVRIVWMGRGYDGADEWPETLEMTDGASVADALRQLVATGGAPNAGEAAGTRELPASCLIAVGGEHLGTATAFRDRALRDGDELTIIAPVAGG